jgi:cellobiose epimerase
MRISSFFLLFSVITAWGCTAPKQIPQDEKELLIQLRDEIVADLTGNLLPFWKQYSVDHTDPNEGFYGAIAFNGEGIPGTPRHNVLFTRYLWTYASAYRVLGDEESLELAHRAYHYLNNFFVDKLNGGVFWVLNADGSVADSSKMTYGLSFAIYAFSEYYRITENKESLENAIEIYRLLEEHALDRQYGGYLESFTADWQHIPGQGMAAGQSMSMNTHLHLLEAYTNLYRVWPDEGLKNRLYAVIDIFWDHILNQDTWHQELYFERDWTVHGRYDSYGHDIEFSWLFDEAGRVLSDKNLIQKIQEASVKIAEVQLNEGMNTEGAMIYEKEGEDHYNRNISWWVQAEAVVGFLNAYELSHDRKYLDAATGVWNYIKNKMIDHEHGGWIPNLDEHGNPRPKAQKGNGWTGPYHNCRMGFEVYERLHQLN